MKTILSWTRINTLIFVVVSFVSCGQSQEKILPEDSFMNSDSEDNALIKRGEYLVTIAGCHDCHSPKTFTDHGPEPNQELLLSGHPGNLSFDDFDASLVKRGWVIMNEHATAFAGPWGVSYAANLTPDPSGIGTWTEENFRIALREGKYKGLPQSRDLLPPMPWPNYSKLTDEDLSAIFAFLKSLKPVSNIVPTYKSFDAS